MINHEQNNENDESKKNSNMKYIVFFWIQGKRYTAETDKLWSCY